jgi:hypothetical protein
MALAPPSVYCQFLNKNNVQAAFYFDKDTEDAPLIPVNTLENMNLVSLYDKRFKKFLDYPPQYLVVFFDETADKRCLFKP